MRKNNLYSGILLSKYLLPLVGLLSLLGFGVTTNTGSCSVRINFTKKTKELNMAEGLKGTGGWLPEHGTFYPSHTSVFITARIPAMCIELKEASRVHSGGTSNLKAAR